MLPPVPVMMHTFPVSLSDISSNTIFGGQLRALVSLHVGGVGFAPEDIPQDVLVYVKS